VLFGRAERMKLDARHVAYVVDIAIRFPRNRGGEDHSNPGNVVQSSDLNGLPDKRSYSGREVTLSVRPLKLHDCRGAIFVEEDEVNTPAWEAETKFRTIDRRQGKRFLESACPEKQFEDVRGRHSGAGDRVRPGEVLGRANHFLTSPFTVPIAAGERAHGLSE
jgi:hypothetical protein